ncbi:phytanoyl-CoA dioxygenase family protein [Mucilaginibacter psychrotolerans]|uniref:Phytanoyl-CoA dioxygenase n=1 Tax=Mucilaginibacter psychrotolerans TaxID=1524096 RepID=A0A4Y8SL40_9SPHI|nr:phytanoyl-CoA dioxygenase family protein [Mucilaginibacter psychrotolerans]TFF39769.1 phytanoyl-CoA dioxygenase [Mucilaginibacter psychrotolerans]
MDFSVDGFTIVEEIYSEKEIAAIEYAIDRANSDRSTFRKTAGLFAIRQFLKEIPAVAPLIFTGRLKNLITTCFGNDYFVVKSIYFDKPELSNWFVAWHQDLTISVDKKLDISGYGPWTVKHEQFAVQPPLEILADNFTIRIHLDDADEGNGALKVVPGSHLRGICRPDTIDWDSQTAVSCDVKAGGVMVMRPLLMHASGRTTNSKPRKVIHIEFSRAKLADGLSWSESQSF